MTTARQRPKESITDAGYVPMHIALAAYRTKRGETVSAEALRFQIRKGRIKGVKYRGRHYVSLDSVEEWKPMPGGRPKDTMISRDTMA